MGIAHSLQSIPFLIEFSESTQAYPIVLSIHLLDIAFFGGMILVTNLRLLGLSFKSLTITDVVKGFRPWKHLGGLLQVCTGSLLAACEAEKYSPNPFFWTKMIILGLIFVHGIVFRPSVYANTEALDKALEAPGAKIPRNVKLAAILSLVLWTAMFTMGRLIAYWDTD